MILIILETGLKNVQMMKNIGVTGKHCFVIDPLKIMIHIHRNRGRKSASVAVLRTEQHPLNGRNCGDLVVDDEKVVQRSHLLATDHLGGETGEDG